MRRSCSHLDRWPHQSTLFTIAITALSQGNLIDNKRKKCNWPAVQKQYSNLGKLTRGMRCEVLHDSYKNQPSSSESADSHQCTTIIKLSTERREKTETEQGGPPWLCCFKKGLPHPPSLSCSVGRVACQEFWLHFPETNGTFLSVVASSTSQRHNCFPKSKETTANIPKASKDKV